MAEHNYLTMDKRSYRYTAGQGNAKIQWEGSERVALHDEERVRRLMQERTQWRHRQSETIFEPDRATIRPQRLVSPSNNCLRPPSHPEPYKEDRPTLAIGMGMAIGKGVGVAIGVGGDREGRPSLCPHANSQERLTLGSKSRLEPLVNKFDMQSLELLRRFCP